MCPLLSSSQEAPATGSAQGTGHSDWDACAAHKAIERRRSKRREREREEEKGPFDLLNELLERQRK